MTKKHKKTKTRNNNVLTFLFALLFLVFAVLYLGEKFGKQKEEEHTERTNVVVRKENGYKRIYNARFEFSCRIPAGWNTEDISMNGDGYFIDCMDKKVDFRIYGQNTIPEIDMEEELSCRKPEMFSFNDGGTGKLCKGENIFEVIRKTEYKAVVLYVESDNNWIDAHMKELINVAKSIEVK